LAKAPKNPTPAGLPTPQQILKYIEESSMAVGKREIAKYFGLKGAEKIALKALLKDMTDEGQIDAAPGRAFHKHGGLPRVTVLRIAAIEGDTLWAVPDRWESPNPPPRVRVMEKGKRALGIGDRILARTEERGKGHIAHPMKRVQSSAETIIGVLVTDMGPSGKPMTWLRPADKRARFDHPVSDMGGAKIGDLVRAELLGRGTNIKAKVTDVIGDPFAPRSLSMIAIAKLEIPHVFGDDVIAEAETASKLPLTADGREDLRHLPILAIDPADARDHDDAVWATPDDNPANDGGWKAIVAIADVSYYVRSDGALDREARRRGNSVYFPDQVVPMLPHVLSSGMCSLKQGEDRAAMACHFVIDKSGQVTSWRFTRALVKLRANIAYERAQAAYDAGQPDDGWDVDVLPTLQNLWGCWTSLAKARDARKPLNLDLPERQVILDELGNIAEIRVRERLDAHRLIEDYMIAANVAAAKALEAKKAPVMYRVHEVPSREKLISLKDYLETFGQSFAMGQVMTPATFNRIIDTFKGEDNAREVMEAVLRTQTQAYYGPVNAGHFGLALGSYGHFTSPIRRYADLLVHRSLVDAYHLEVPHKPKSLPEKTGLGEHDRKGLAQIGEVISRLERRAMEAERETIDRYVAAWLGTKVGEIVAARITGVQNFGFFATVDGLGGDGLVPVSTLGRERFHYDEAARTLDSELGRVSYWVGQRLDLRLVEANPISGSLRFELPDAAEEGHPQRRCPRRDIRRDGKGKHMVGPRARPKNIRHKGRNR
jgi:ribonuclease R